METLYERKVVCWMVRFDTGASHHCKTYQEAVQFASELAGNAPYGKPVAITKITRHVTSTYEDVLTFDDGGDVDE